MEEMMHYPSAEFNGILIGDIHETEQQIESRPPHGSLSEKMIFHCGSPTAILIAMSAITKTEGFNPVEQAVKAMNRPHHRICATSILCYSN